MRSFLGVLCVVAFNPAIGLAPGVGPVVALTFRVTAADRYHGVETR